MDDAVEFSLYTFSASAPLAPEGEISHIFYTAPVATDIVADVSPTITRRFYADTTRIKKEPLDNSRLSVGLSDQGEPGPASASRPSSRSTTPFRFQPLGARTSSVASIPASKPPSVAPSRNVSRTPSIAQSSLRGASLPPDNWPDFLPPSGMVTRSQSRASLTDGEADSTASTTAATAAATIASSNDMPSQHAKCFPDAPTIELRHPVQERKCQRTDEEKEKNVAVGEFKTRWYESWDTSIFSTPPPDMAEHRDLQLGDLFCHWTQASWKPTIWLWSVGSNNRLGWLAVSPGHPRPEDERRLELTASHRPSWRGQSERLSAKAKGKQRGLSEGLYERSASNLTPARGPQAL
ncbi:hypothetical protein LXA43DRAFT_1095922 [Ganoderma leucocontextum]|nr:hypothetical protein LXA43DRAFT_1095922 [Ganoderma leucocontextum]